MGFCQLNLLKAVHAMPADMIIRVSIMILFTAGTSKTSCRGKFILPLLRNSWNPHCQTLPAILQHQTLVCQRKITFAPTHPRIDVEMHELPSNTSGHALDPEAQVQLDDIKVEYHPKSMKPDKFFRFHEYTDVRTPTSDLPNQEPWKPFRTRLDFELADLMLDARMNAKQSASLLSLIHRCIKDPESFTISNVTDLQNAWNHARNLKGTGVCRIFFDTLFKL
jgi:hypothetical protein